MSFHEHYARVCVCVCVIPPAHRMAMRMTLSGLVLLFQFQASGGNINDGQSGKIHYIQVGPDPPISNANKENVMYRQNKTKQNHGSKQRLYANHPQPKIDQGLFAFQQGKQD